MGRTGADWLLIRIDAHASELDDCTKLLEHIYTLAAAGHLQLSIPLNFSRHLAHVHDHRAAAVL
jgi:hypothetical protein